MEQEQMEQEIQEQQEQNIQHQEPQVEEQHEHNDPWGEDELEDDDELEESFENSYEEETPKQEIESDDEILLADEGDGKLSVVAGLDEEGKLKTVPPKQENEGDFMKVDKHSNALENFLTNYFAQAENPKHIGFYRVAMEGVQQIAGVIKGLINDGGEEGKMMLDEYRVDTSKYERMDVEMTRGPQEGEKPQEQKREYQPLSADMIDWDAFAKIGISKEYLEKSGALDSMLNYRRSPDLMQVTMSVDDIRLKTDARISLRKTADNTLIPVVHAVRKSPQLERPFYGNTFTDEDKANLIKNGHLGRTLDLHFKEGEAPVKAYVSVDPKTNELVAYSTKNVRIPNEIKGVKLDDKQKQDLMEGRSIRLEGMTAKNGKQFNANIQISGSERGIVFSFDKYNRQAQTQSQEGVRIPSKLGGAELSKEQQSDLKKGGVIYVENMVDKKGQTYNAYVRVNNEKGKLDFHKRDPRQTQGVTADNASQTQVAVNSQGKSTEATKHNPDPLKKGEIKQEPPKQNKPKMRM